MRRVTAYGPPWAMTSSPRMLIVSSRAISSCRASRKASRMLIFGMDGSLSSVSMPGTPAQVLHPAKLAGQLQCAALGVLVRINVLVQLIWRWIGAALRKTHRFLNICGDALLNRLILGIRQDPRLLHVGC